MNEDMDDLRNNPGSLGVLHRFLNFIILPTEGPVCNALAIFSRLFTFTASSAVLAAQDFKKHLSLGGFLGHGWSIVQRLYDWIMQTLEAQSMKSVTLGHVPDFHASQSQNGTSTRNDQNLHFMPHKNPSEDDYYPVNAAKQAELVEYDCSPPGGARELLQFQKSVDEDVHSSCSTFPVEDGEEMEKDQKLTLPTIVLVPRKRAPKKTVSINENVEIYPLNNKRRKMTIERLPSREDGDEESKPLKSILKVVSNVKDKVHST